MKGLLFILLLGSAFLIGCTSSEPQSPPPSTEDDCRVDSLIQDIKGFRTISQKKTTTAALEQGIQAILKGLEATADPDSTCNYLNTEIQPQHVRFDFVDDLRVWTVRDTFTQGVYYLLELRGLFADDSAIYEFFSEEIALVAMENPACYDRYLRAHPGQMQMLLNTTQWSFQNVAQCKAQFQAIDALPEITSFLTDLLPLGQ